jgi:hypothetical protein
MRPLVDRNLPVSQLRITLNNGQSATLEVNDDTKVSDLHTWVMSVCPVGYNTYQLVSGYPPMGLVNPEATVR